MKNHKTKWTVITVTKMVLFFDTAIEACNFVLGYGGELIRPREIQS